MQSIAERRPIPSRLLPRLAQVRRIPLRHDSGESRPALATHARGSVKNSRRSLRARLRSVESALPRERPSRGVRSVCAPDSREGFPLDPDLREARAGQAARASVSPLRLSRGIDTSGRRRAAPVLRSRSVWATLFSSSQANSVNKSSSSGVSTTRSAFAMLREIPLLTGASEIVLSHQERWGGEGYPRKLRRQESNARKRSPHTAPPSAISITARSTVRDRVAVLDRVRNRLAVLLRRHQVASRLLSDRLQCGSAYVRRL
jgi:HD domain